MKYTLEQRFWSKVNKDTGTDCWEWTGTYSGKTTRKEPRPNFGVDKKMWVASRYLMTMLGKDPTGLLVCHHCDNPKCVNPDHLYLGTQQDNMNDKVKRGRQFRHTLRELTDDQVREIRSSPKTHKEISSIYNITTSSVSYIKRRLRYADVK